jgi:hypothetical protein
MYSHLRRNFILCLPLFSMVAGDHQILYIRVGWFSTFFYIFNKSTPEICYIPSKSTENSTKILFDPVTASSLVTFLLAPPVWEQAAEVPFLLGEQGGGEKLAGLYCHCGTPQRKLFRACGNPHTRIPSGISRGWGSFYFKEAKCWWITTFKGTIRIFFYIRMFMFEA